jgi:hypothetical protein
MSDNWSGEVITGEKLKSAGVPQESGAAVGKRAALKVS